MMVKEIEFDGAHRGIVAKKAFAYHSLALELAIYAARKDQSAEGSRFAKQNLPEVRPRNHTSRNQARELG